jgi:hypothetical protein
LISRESAITLKFHFFMSSLLAVLPQESGISC